MLEPYAYDESLNVQHMSIYCIIINICCMMCQIKESNKHKDCAKYYCNIQYHFVMLHTTYTKKK